MTAGALPAELTAIRARRAALYRASFGDPAFWEWAAGEARSRAARGSTVEAGRAGTFAALSMVAGWAATALTTDPVAAPGSNWRKPEPIKHGTDAGYHQHVHRRRRDPDHEVCGACREAHRARERQRTADARAGGQA